MRVCVFDFFSLSTARVCGPTFDVNKTTREPLPRERRSPDDGCNRPSTAAEACACNVFETESRNSAGNAAGRTRPRSRREVREDRAALSSSPEDRETHVSVRGDLLDSRCSLSNRRRFARNGKRPFFLFCYFISADRLASRYRLRAIGRPRLGNNVFLAPAVSSNGDDALSRRGESKMSARKRSLIDFFLVKRTRRVRLLQYYFAVATRWWGKKKETKSSKNVSRKLCGTASPDYARII